MNIRSLGVYTLFIYCLLTLGKLAEPKISLYYDGIDVIISLLAFGLLMSGFYVGFRFTKTIKTPLRVHKAILNVLTVRENEVLEAASRGLSNAGIADSLCISVPTVKSHLSNV
ncbi:MAG: hypothetical protein ACI9IP_002130 [Arcticibacterium sp.]|jgi:hypothetical protein